MYYDLNPVARERLRETERELEARRHMPRPRTRSRGWASRIAGKALVRAGAALSALGNQLECRGIRIVAKARAA